MTEHQTERQTDGDLVLLSRDCADLIDRRAELRGSIWSKHYCILQPRIDWCSYKFDQSSI